MSFTDLFKLLRINNYYKNLLIFLPLLFVSQLFSPDPFLRVFLGFIALCAVSSANYIFNDIIDKNKDIHHPEKRFRPIASGKVWTELALFVGITLLIISFLLSYMLSFYFFLFVLALFILTNLYSLFLKQILFLDIIFISINFVLRAIAGAFIIFPNKIIRISPWLILVPFFLALFLATAKRRSNLIYLGEHASKYNKLLEHYDFHTSSFLFTTSTTLLIFTYALFTFFSDFPLLIITIPIVLYAIFRFYKLTEEGHIVSRNLFYGLKDKNLSISFILWCLITIAIIYL